MAAAYDWFRTVAASLNDDKPNAPFKRYALKDLVAYYNDALCLIAKHRPDLFAEVANVKLQCGSLQDVRKCCEVVLGVIAQVDAYGNTIKNLTENKKTDTKVKSLWDKPSCLSRGKVDPTTGNPLDYVVDTVTIDELAPGHFTVTPPVPVGTDAYLLIRCVKSPCAITEAAVLDGTAKFGTDCGYLAAVRFYVLGWALTGDRHSEAAQGEATRSFKLFFDWLGVAEKQDEKYERAAS